MKVFPTILLCRAYGSFVIPCQQSFLPSGLEVRQTRSRVVNNAELKMKDTLGEVLKAKEQVECGRKADRTKPLMVRLDGRSFSTFTRGLKKPYDIRMSQLMIDTTAHLVHKTGAKLGYTQSDEISLYWSLDLEGNAEAQYLFNGRFQKIGSVVASMATAYFNYQLATRIPEKASELPAFDSRVWNVDDARDVYLNFLWRQNDAITNSVAAAAQSCCSNAELYKRDRKYMQEILRIKGRAWENEPQFFKSGTFVGRISRKIELSAEELAKIPEALRPSGPVERVVIGDLGVGLLKDEETNTVERLFEYRRVLEQLDGDIQSESSSTIDGEVVIR